MGFIIVLARKPQKKKETTFKVHSGWNESATIHFLSIYSITHNDYFQKSITGSTVLERALNIIVSFV